MSRTPPRRLAVIASLLAVLAFAQAPPPVDEAALTVLLMTAAEKAELARLSADAARDYVDAFWARRDPSPGTPENELRAVFLRRAERATMMFTDEPQPGWSTDRGRVLAVMGLPDEIERRAVEPGAPAPEIAWTYRRGSTPLRVVFTASDGAFRLQNALTLDAATFYASAQLELRLLVAAGVGAVEGMAPTVPGKPAVPPPTSTGTPPTPTLPAAVPDTVAPEVAVWMQMIYAGVMRDDLGVAARLDTMPAREGTYTVLSFEIEREGLTFETAAEVAARLAPPQPAATAAAAAGATADPAARTAAGAVGDPEAVADPDVIVDPDAVVQEAAATEAAAASGVRASMPSARLRLFGAYLQGEPGAENTVHAFIIPFEVPLLEADLGEDPPLMPEEGDAAAVVPAVRSAMRSAAVTLMPGTYRLAWGILDEATGAATTRDEVVEIPDYVVGGFGLTRPLLVHPPHQQAVRELTADEVIRGIRLGSLVLDADLDATFARDDIVEVVLMATGWATDPGQPGKPLLEVEYRIVAADGGRVLARLPGQSLDFSILGQQIPLGQVRAIEAGHEYRIEVRVKDLVGGQEAVASTPIRIAAAISPEAPQ